jgi:hypothetical protein
MEEDLPRLAQVMYNLRSACASAAFCSSLSPIPANSSSP